MPKPKLTPWFPASVNPVRVGVYERDIAPLGPYSYWNGLFWGGWAAWPDIAVNNYDKESLIQNTRWRGLATQSKEQKHER